MIVEVTDRMSDAQPLTVEDILLNQMIGRALRGPRMGGTEKAYIVAFIDIWKYEIKWAEYGQIIPKSADNEASESHGLSPQVILADLVRRLAQQMDITIDNITGLFLTLLPLGWYKVEFETVAKGSENGRRMRELVMVFEGEKDAYEGFSESMAQAPNQ
jgi:superfamily II DNA or RNA helicase